MRKSLVVLYGAASYGLFLVTFLYAIGFVGNVGVPKTIDSGPAGAFWPSLAINTGLLGLFALQHSGMARPGFKEWLTTYLPESMERSTYVLASSIALGLILWQWRPLPTVVWDVDVHWGELILWGLYGSGWTVVLVATFLISHAHLFGLKQVLAYWKGTEAEQPGFQTPGLYRHLRHPIMLGFVIAFWSTPEMTVGHLLFSVCTTAYIIAGLHLEERDLMNAFGKRYRRYRRKVPMLIPRLTPVETPDAKAKSSDRSTTRGARAGAQER